MASREQGEWRCTPDGKHSCPSLVTDCQGNPFSFTPGGLREWVVQLRQTGFLGNFVEKKKRQKDKSLLTDIKLRQCSKKEATRTLLTSLQPSLLEPILGLSRLHVTVRCALLLAPDLCHLLNPPHNSPSP